MTSKTGVNCLICSNNDANFQFGTKRDEFLINLHNAEEAVISDELKVIFVIRNILGIPREFCENLIYSNGNPSTWGLEFCSVCRRIILEAEFVFQRIKKLVDDFDELSSGLKEKALKSWQEGDGSKVKGKRKSSGSDVVSDQLRAQFKHLTTVKSKGESPSKYGVRELIQDDYKIDTTAEPSSVPTSGNNGRRYQPRKSTVVKQNSEDFASLDENLLDEATNDGDQVESYPIVRRKFACPQCGRKFASTIQIEGHIKRFHEGLKSPYECKICKAKFQRPSKLKTHMIEIHDESITDNEESTMISSISINNIRSVSDNNDTFSNSEDTFEENIKMCGEEQDKSEETGRKSLSPKKLTQRLDIGDTESIEADDMDFGDLSDSEFIPLSPGWAFEGDGIKLSTEKAGENSSKKKYKCPESGCSRAYSSQHLIDAHVKRFHKGDKNPYECEICGAKFTRPGRLKNHKIEKHDESASNENSEDEGNAENLKSDSTTFQEKREVRNSVIDIKTEVEDLDYLDDPELAPESPEWKPSDEESDSDGYESLKVQRNKAVDDDEGSKEKRTTTKRKALSKAEKNEERRRKRGKYDLKCEECHQSFKEQYMLDAHILRKHFGEENPFACDLCDKKFRYINRVLLHKAKCHPEAQNTYLIPYEEQKDGEHNPGDSTLGQDDEEYVKLADDSTFNTSSLHESPLHLKIREVINEDNGKHECEECKQKFASITRRDGHVNRSHKGMQRPFVCIGCDKTFERLSSIREHYQAHLIKRNLLPCTHEDCKNVFETEIDRENHVRKVHLGILKAFKCPKCPKAFKAQDSMYYHMRNQHKINRNQVIKGLSFKTETKLYEKPVASPSKPVSLPAIFKCTKCQLRFPSKLSVEAHLRRVHYDKEPQIPCTVESCERKFFKKAEVWKHIEEFHNEVPKPKAKSRSKICELCKKEFKTASSLDHHVRSYHNKERHYMCEFCSKSFVMPRYLEYHQKAMHYKELGVKPFKCNQCSMILNNEGSLDRHIKQVHKKEYLFPCTVCPQGYMCKAMLILHMRLHTGEKPYKCPECPKAFPKKFYLKNHMRVHTKEKPWSCNVCEKAFSDRPTYNRHMEIHGSTVYKCSSCGKEFKVWHSYRLHMKTHGRKVARRFQGPNAKLTAGNNLDVVEEGSQSNSSFISQEGTSRTDSPTSPEKVEEESVGSSENVDSNASSMPSLHVEGQELQCTDLATGSEFPIPTLVNNSMFM